MCMWNRMSEETESGGRCYFRTHYYSFFKWYITGRKQTLNFNWNKVQHNGNLSSMLCHVPPLQWTAALFLPPAILPYRLWVAQELTFCWWRRGKSQDYPICICSTSPALLINVQICFHTIATTPSPSRPWQRHYYQQLQYTFWFTSSSSFCYSC